MTNKEILQADLLDILFEHRNKSYGAYALRKTYSHRLGIALGVALSTVLLFVLMYFINKNGKGNTNRRHDDIVKLTQLVIPVDKPKEPEPPIDKPKPPTATVDYQKFKIVPNDEADKNLVDIKDIQNAGISNETNAGEKPDGLAKTKTETEGNGVTPKKEPEEDNTLLPSYPPSFPGGPEAWLNFLRKYLQAPEDLDAGQRIEVQVKVWIDVDGNVSNPEIIKSGGKSFDKEVLRVLNKMPRWQAAMQGGKPIKMAYTQPVTFIGQEE